MTDAVPHSCIHCQTRFLIDNCDPELNSRASLGFWRIWSPSEKQVTMQDLEKLASAGCSFAKYILRKITPEDNNFSSSDLVARYPPDSYEDYPNSLIIGLPSRQHPYAQLTCMVDEESPVAQEVAQRPPNIEPGSEESFRLARTWLRNCLEDHQSCPKPLSNFMPTRVLEISDLESSVYIREKLSAAPYAALSYCWGGPQLVSLTKSRQRIGRYAIPNDSLPQTIQDAMHVARELGLKYIWIDSLCIIQDDEEDMSTEIGQMADIYQQSYVTIMASRAKSVEEGFLYSRFPFGATNSNPGFRLPYRTKDGQTGSIIAIEEDVSIAYINPLRQRGWAFQEFVLAPRILDYEQMGTTWICQNSETPTDGFSSPLSTIWSRLVFRSLDFENGSLASIASPSNIKSPEDRLNFLHMVWTGIVQEYMKGALTCFQDRLPALGGIAQRMAIHLEDEYVAGGWTKCVWQSLVWHNENGRQWKRLPGYFAPSWSWASIPNGVVGFISTNHSFPDENFRVVDCKVEPVNQAAKYGAVKSGFLTVCGRVLSARYTHRRGSPGPDDSSVHIDGLENHHVEASSCGLYLDVMVNGIQEGEIPLWFLCVCWDYKRNKMSGLFLSQLRDGTYVRWGLFSLFLTSRMDPNEEPPVNLTQDESQSLDLYAHWRASIPIKTVTIV